MKTFTLQKTDTGWMIVLHHTIGVQSAIGRRFLTEAEALEFMARVYPKFERKV